MAGGGRPARTCLLLGAAGGGKSLLARRLRQLSTEDGPAELGEPPATLPTVGTDLTDLRLPRRVTLRELGGCMGPVWHGYYGDCGALLVSGPGTPAPRRRGPPPSHGPRGAPGSCPWRGAGAGPPRFRRGCARPGWGGGRPRAPPLSLLFQFVVDAANPTQVSSSCAQLLSVLSAAQLASVPVLVLFNKIDLPCYMSLVEMKSLFRMQDIISCATQPIATLDTSARDGTGLADVLQWLRATLGGPR
ncbi:ADP-ribosylation factor-like protein 16 isoform X3 [Tyto alba]|uniref:ADP-ribosylation factor-like protein 16 isoform X3 n=1 Tax=Tyto alba TaxID=56313 RepID=UPI001C668E25|nr:ADP-ribosylation factor-like protein 16 isoform X3 [Tyto alba]